MRIERVERKFKRLERNGGMRRKKKSLQPASELTLTRERESVSPPPSYRNKKKEREMVVVMVGV